MRTVALSRHLAVFDQASHRASIAHERSTPATPAVAAPSLDDVRRVREAALAEGYARAQSEREVETAARAAEMESAYRERFEREKAAWREEAIGEIARQLREGFDGLETELAEAVAETLGELVDSEKRGKIVDAFARCLHELLADGGAASLKIDAPAEFVDKISVQSLFDGRFVDISAGAAGECRARVDRAIVRARFESWADDVGQLVRRSQP